MTQVNWDLNVKPGETRISSIDRYVEISIDPHFQTFQVTFPYLVYDPDQVKGVYKYTLVTQRHPTNNPPKYWIFPLRLLLGALTPNYTEPKPMNPLKSELVDHLRLLSKPLLYDSNPIIILGQSHLTSQIPIPSLESYLPSHPLNITFKPPRITTLVHLDPITVIQTSTAIHHDRLIILPDFIIKTDFNFVRVYQDNEEQVYPFDGLEKVNGYSIKQELGFALGIYQSSLKHIQSSPITQPRIKSFKVIHSLSIPHIGDFTRYIDHVKTHFDGTVIEIEDGLCHVLDIDGEKLIIRKDNPVGYEEYLDAMLQYMNWVDSGCRIKSENIAAMEKVRERKDVIAKALDKLNLVLKRR